MKPKVSIIMGIYNCEKTLDACINSILTQTYTNWELIMCDDCSEDKTYEIARKYSDKYCNIKLLQNTENRRLAYTLNRCLEFADGDYVARMDSDDECLPTRFEKQVEFLNDNKKYALVGTAMKIFDETGITSIRRCKKVPDGPETWSTTPFAHPTIMMRKQCYEALNGYTVSIDTMRAEDLDLWFRFYMNGYIGYNLQEPLYLYREGKEDYKKRTLLAAIHTAKLRYEWHRRLNLPILSYWLCIKPIISSLVPVSILFWLHNRSNK